MFSKKLLAVVFITFQCIRYTYHSGDTNTLPAKDQVIKQDVIYVLDAFQLSELSTDKITARFYIVDTSKVTSEKASSAALLGDYYGLLELGGNSTYNLLNAQLPKDTFFNSEGQELTETQINEKLNNYKFEFSKVENAHGYICTFLESPTDAVITTSIKNKRTIKFRRPGRINCNKVNYKVSGKIKIKPRGFEFYSSLMFNVSISETGKTDKNIAEAYVTYTTDIDDSKIDKDGFGPEVAVKFNNEVLFGTDITIRAVCDTSDYYACEIDNAIGVLNNDLSFEIKCSPRSKKYDKLYTTAWSLAIVLLVVLGASVAYHYHKNSRTEI